MATFPHRIIPHHQTVTVVVDATGASKFKGGENLLQALVTILKVACKWSKVYLISNKFTVWVYQVYTGNLKLSEKHLHLHQI